MKNKIAIMLNGKPMLPGTVAAYHNVCGKTPCRCKDKDNPQKHGPYFQLSYNLNGKNSSISVKKEDVKKITQMTDNYRIHVQNTRNLGLELLELYKNEGYEATIEKYEQLVDRETNRRAGKKPESFAVQENKKRVDLWKNKAVERRNEIDKAKVTIRDLTTSRNNWKSKNLRAQSKIKELQEEILTLKKTLNKKRSS